MDATSHIEKMDKLLQLCPNGNVPPLELVTKLSKDPENSKLTSKKKSKNFIEKFKNFSFKNYKNSKHNDNSSRKLMGCACKLSNHSLEYCTMIAAILDRIQKLETKNQIRAKVSSNGKNYQPIFYMNPSSLGFNNIPIARKNMYSEYYGLSSEITQKSLANNLLLVEKHREPINSKIKVNINAIIETYSKNCNNATIKPSSNPNPELLAVPALKIDKSRHFSSANQHIKSKDSDNSDTSLSDGFNIKHKRTNSNPVSMPQEDIVFMIEKDLKRTFQTHKYFKNEAVQFHLKQVLLQIGLQFNEIGYVQGMNFIVGCIVYHCNNFVDTAKIFTFLIENLQMEQIYTFSHLSKYVDVLKRLLEIHVSEFYSFSQTVIKLDYNIHLIDWFFCLGLNKIPLEQSQYFLENLIQYGWYYFYRVLINYFKLFEEKHLKLVKMPNLSENKKVDVEVMIKNFYKEKNIDWGVLLRKSVSSAINDKIIKVELVWETRDKFTKPGFRIN